MKAEHPRCRGFTDYLVLLVLCVSTMVLAQQQREAAARTPTAPSTVLATSLAH